MVVAINAYEQIFEGLHGMCSKAVYEVDSLEEAREIAEEMSLDVINGYYEIQERLMEEAEDIADEYQDYDEAFDSVCECDINYEIYVLKEEVKDYDFDEINQMYYNSPESFLEEFQDLDA